MNSSSKSFELAKQYLGKEVNVVIDRPLGSKYPKHDFVYEANYGFIEGVKAPDGEELDAYYLGIQKPLKSAKGICIAIAHRKDDDDDKLIVVPKKIIMSDEQIMSAIHFQEQGFDTEIVR
jgi:inorganic pyrophosphatase